MNLDQVNRIALKVVKDFEKDFKPDASELAIARLIASEMKSAIYMELNKL